MLEKKKYHECDPEQVSQLIKMTNADRSAANASFAQQMSPSTCFDV